MDADIVLASVQQTGYAYQFASGALREVVDLLWLALVTYPEAVLYAPDHLRNTPAIALAAVSLNGFILESLPAAMQAYLPVVLCAVRQNGLALHYACAALRASPEVVQTAVAQNPAAGKYALTPNVSPVRRGGPYDRS